jgi:hypothetical protein
MDDTIFNFIDSVLFTKKKLNTINEGETQFNLYMLNRWGSMYSSDVAYIINETSNKYGKLFQTKEEQYQFVLNMLPKVKKKRINYIKKTKEEAKKEDNEILLIAKAMEISKRELEQNIKFLEEIETNH